MKQPILVPKVLQRSFLAACLALSLSACQQSAQKAADNEQKLLAATGKDIVQENCLSCHSLDRRLASPRPDAPPLSEVLNVTSADALTDDFREGIHVGDPDMPDFNFGPVGADAVVTYLKSIQTPPAP